MSQEDQNQFIVPFGKYKGKPIERLLKDESYVKWLAGQDWVQEKYQSLYTFIIHNHHAEPVDTPEHNQMQIKFLNEIHALKLAYLCSDKKLFQFDNIHFDKTAPSFISDLKQHNIDLQEIKDEFEKLRGKSLLYISNIKFEEKGLDVKYDVSYGYSKIGPSERSYRMAPSVFDKFWNNSFSLKIRVELKPYVGDDYPTVLRQIKTSGANILIIREYTGTGVTYNDFTKFFISQGIRVFKEKEIEQVELPVYDKVFKINDIIINKLRR